MLVALALLVGASACHPDREDPLALEPLEGTLAPRFIVTHVLYAVPGKGNATTYGPGRAIGPTVSLRDSAEHLIEAKAQSEDVVVGDVGGLRVTAGAQWGTHSSTALDLGVQHSGGHHKEGSQDSIGPDDDEVWFLVGALLRLAAIVPGSTEVEPGVSWTLDPTSTPQALFLDVGQLHGRRPIPADVQESLDRWGVGPSDFPELLKADPFAEGALADGPMDPARFEILGGLPYRPVQTLGGSASEFTWGIAHERDVPNTSRASRGITYAVNAELAGPPEFLDASAALIRMDGRVTFSALTSARIAVAGGEDVIRIAQPPYGYEGPTVLRLYLDKVWKTYLFTLDAY